MQTLIIIRPDDMYLHLCDGDALQAVASYTARQMGCAVTMPNLRPPVVGVADALTYKARIMVALPEGSAFTPLMAPCLTDRATPELMRKAKAVSIVAFRLYPTGATTNSDFGVTDLFKFAPVLEEMARQGILFLVHGEVIDPEINILDREAAFIKHVMKPILTRVPDLKVVSEYITTAETARLVLDTGDNAATSVTPQHLLFDCNDLLVSDVCPHHFCLPVFKRKTHRRTLVAAVTDEKVHKFFLGIDSAPHTGSIKESACGYAGIFSAMTAIELYAEVLERAGMLDKLEAFFPKDGTRFYGIPESTDTITPVEQSRIVPASILYDDGEFILMRTGGETDQTVRYWKFQTGSQTGLTILTGRLKRP